MDLLNRHQYRH